MQDIGPEGTDEARRTWRILYRHAHRFIREEGDEGGDAVEPERVQLSKGKRVSLSAGGDAASSGGGLKVDPCRRMLSILAKPLVKPLQLEAIFSGFDTNKDGLISEQELELLLRLLNPHRRLEKHMPIQVMVEERETPIAKLLKAASETVQVVAAPRLAVMGDFMHQLTTDPMSFFEDDSG